MLGLVVMLLLLPLLLLLACDDRYSRVVWESVLVLLKVKISSMLQSMSLLYKQSISCLCCCYWILEKMLQEVTWLVLLS